MSRSKWAAVRLAVLDRDGWRCTRCGKAGKLEVHHVHHLEKGGAEYDVDNLRTLCLDCHHVTHSKLIPHAVQRWRDLVNEML